jgi:hypothetical protein
VSKTSIPEFSITLVPTSQTAQFRGGNKGLKVITSQVWLCVPATPAIQEVEVEGLRSEASLGKVRDPNSN